MDVEDVVAFKVDAVKVAEIEVDGVFSVINEDEVDLVNCSSWATQLLSLEIKCESPPLTIQASSTPYLRQSEIKENISKIELLPEPLLPTIEVRLVKPSSLVLLNLPKVISFRHLKFLIWIPRSCAMVLLSYEFLLFQDLPKQGEVTY